MAKKPKAVKTKMDYIKWVQQSQTGKRWFARLQAKKGSPHTTLYGYAIALHKFAEFKNAKPDQIFAEYKRAAKQDLDEALDTIETDLDLFVNWLVENRIKQIENYDELSEVEQQKIRDKARASSGHRHSAIRSWLKNNAKSLTGIPSPEVYSEVIPPLSYGELKQIIDSSDVHETFYTMLLKDTGLSRAEAVKVNYGDIAKQYESKKQFIRIEVTRRKEHVNYEAWFGPNTIAALKPWLNIRRRRGEQINDDTPLFAGNIKPYGRLSPEGLSAIYIRITEKTGIKITTHRIRKFYETYMALGHPHPIILKYWMGHKIKSGKADVDQRYIIPPMDEQRKLYAECYKHIDLTPKPDEFEVWLSEIEARKQGMTPEQKQRFMKQLSFRHPRFIKDPRFKVLFEKDEQPADGGLAAEPAFKEINESELLVYLENGWQIVHNLQNGSVIVRKGR